MRVWQAGMIGLVVGLGMSRTSFSLVDQLMLIVTILAVLAILLRRKMITGPLGGFLAGFAAGYSLGSYIS